MSGDIDPPYVRARIVLLDALEALRDQLDAVILVGAQAIYLNIGETDLAVAPFTTDADLAFDPQSLKIEPKLAEAMHAAGFVEKDQQVGTWISCREGTAIDLMVPEAVGGAGSRAARLGEHGKRVARKARGLEAALIDKRVQTIRSLEDGDPRFFEVAVAGSVALLIAKLHKLEERRQDAGRRSDKDALDIYRILQATDTQELAIVFKALFDDPLAGDVAHQALTYLENLFGTDTSVGSGMAAQAATPLIDHDEVTSSCAVLAQDLLEQVRE